MNIISCLYYFFAPVCVVLSTNVDYANVINSNANEDDRYKMGEQQLQYIKKEANGPRFGQCWLNALKHLDHGCKNLNEDNQHKMTWYFTNCFLLKTGRQQYDCSPEITIENCIKVMKPEAYGVYVEFFTHTQNICFFLQSHAWQQATDMTIGKLADTSAFVAQQIENSSELQSEIIKQQNESIRNQQVLIEKGIDLRKTLDESKTDVRLMMAEFKATTSEQKDLIFEVFDRIKSLQSIVMGEFSGFYSLIFYVLSILVSYLVTSTPRTSGARFWLFLVMTANIIVERLIIAWGVPDKNDTSTTIFIDENTVLFERLRWCRKCCSIFAIIIWTWMAARFKDYNKINNQLLIDIKFQNSELKKMLQSTNQWSIDETDMEIDVPRRPTKKHIDNNIRDLNLTNQTTGYETYSTDESSSTLDRSFDDTYVARKSDPSKSNDSIESMRSLREGTPALLEELKFLQQSTPIKNMSSRANKRQSMTDHLNISNVSTRKTERLSLPSKVSSSPQYHYNLRSRSSNVTTLESPQVYDESPEEFGYHVKRLAQLSVRNRAKAVATVERLQASVRKESPSSTKIVHKKS